MRWALAALIMLLGTSAWADASVVYEQGKVALAQGDHAKAALYFSRADELEPHPAALEAALLAVLLSDEPALGMELATRTTRDGSSDKLRELADRARAKFKDDAGRIVVRCDACDATIDGAPVARGVARWVDKGVHAVEMVRGRARQSSAVDVPAGEVITVTFDPQSVISPEPNGSDETVPSSDGISPLWFVVGLSMTAAAGTATIISFIDTAAIHSDFEGNPSQKLADDGDAAQTRTQVLLGISGALAVTTIVLGLFTDWGTNDGADNEVSFDAGAVTWRF